MVTMVFEKSKYRKIEFSDTIINNSGVTGIEFYSNYVTGSL